MRDVPVRRQHDRRPMECVDQLGGDDADDAAMPAFTSDDDDRTRADLEIRFNRLARVWR